MTTDDTTQQLPPESPPPRRLLRSRSDRVIGGVCAGLGRYFNVDPIIFRIGAVVLAFVGGAGLLAYLAALLLIPSEDSPAAAGAPPSRNRWLVIVGVVVLLCIAWPFLLGGGLVLAGILIPLAILVAAGVLVWWFVSGEGPGGDAGDVARRAALGIGILVLCGLIAIGGAWAAAAGGETVVAIVVIAAGAAILLGAFLRPVRWLVLPAVALALAAGVVSAAGIDLDGGVGERDYRPASAADLRDTYQLGIGELVRGPAPDRPAGGRRAARARRRHRRGSRDRARRRLRGHRRATSASARHARSGCDNDGVDVDFEDTPEASAGTTRLLVKADVGVGSLRIGHERDRLVPRGRALRLRPGPRRARTKRGLCRVAPTSARWSPASRCWRSAAAAARRPRPARPELRRLRSRACAATGAILLANGLTRRR